LTDAAVLEKVWGVQSIAVDARPGGQTEATYIVDGEDWSFTLTYSEIVPHERLRWVVRFKAFPSKQTKVTIALRAALDGTELNLRMENFETASERHANRQAWEAGLATLAVLLA
jgi:uncharacterized protein YndB with AHSA1/START domain